MVLHLISDPPLPPLPFFYEGTEEILKLLLNYKKLSAEYDPKKPNNEQNIFVVR